MATPADEGTMAVQRDEMVRDRQAKINAAVDVLRKYSEGLTQVASTWAQIGSAGYVVEQLEALVEFVGLCTPPAQDDNWRRCSHCGAPATGLNEPCGRCGR